LIKSVTNSNQLNYRTVIPKGVANVKSNFIFTTP
jgi:hypothetical protein